jgi:glyoxylase-like metal-dependent hydrolase (beta-lactamase superfamily II)
MIMIFARYTLLGFGLCSSLLTLLLTLDAQAQEDRFAKVQITQSQLAPNVYVFMGAGGNIGVSSGDDGLLIIDDQFAPLADKISEALNTLQPGMPKYVINTHFHGDHTGGNSHFGEQGTIVAHHNVLARLSEDKSLSKTALPVITFDKGLSVHFNNDTLEVKHLGPGHTDGDSIVIWKTANVIHMGDLFFKDKFPFIDLDHGGSILGYRDNVSAALALINDKTQVIPGHGEMATKNDLLKFKHMLDDSINWMRKEISLGKSLAQIKKQGVPKKWKQWGWEFISEDKWINTLHLGLAH